MADPAYTFNGRSFATLEDLQRNWDEAAYMAANPDVDQNFIDPSNPAWATTWGTRGLTHFLRHGATEGRGGTFLAQPAAAAPAGPAGLDPTQLAQARAYDQGLLVRQNAPDQAADSVLVANSLEAKPRWAGAPVEGQVGGGDLAQAFRQYAIEQGYDRLDPAQQQALMQGFIGNWIRNYTGYQDAMRAEGVDPNWTPARAASQDGTTNAEYLSLLGDEAVIGYDERGAPILAGQQRQTSADYGRGPELMHTAWTPLGSFDITTTPEGLSAVADQIDGGFSDGLGIIANAMTSPISSVNGEAITGATPGGALPNWDPGAYLTGGANPAFGSEMANAGLTAASLLAPFPFGALIKGVTNAGQIQNANKNMQWMSNVPGQSSGGYELGLSDWLEAMVPIFGNSINTTANNKLSQFGKDAGLQSGSTSLGNNDHHLDAILNGGVVPSVAGGMTGNAASQGIGAAVTNGISGVIAAQPGGAAAVSVQPLPPPAMVKCFPAGTRLEIEGGGTIAIERLKADGSIRLRGGDVLAIHGYGPAPLWLYRGVAVTGSHLVWEDGAWVAVAQSRLGQATDQGAPVYGVDTSEGEVWVSGVRFADHARSAQARKVRPVQHRAA